MYSAMSAIDTMANPESSDESKDLAIKTLNALGANGWKWKDNNRIFDNEEKELLKAQVQRNAISLSDSVKGGREDYQRGGYTFNKAQSVDTSVQKITDAMTEFNKHKLDSGDERSLLIKEKMSKDYDYKYSDEHFNDATKTLKPLIDLSSISNESNLGKKTPQGNRVFNDISPIQPKFSSVGFESPSQQQGGINGVNMVRMLNDSASSLQRAANRLEKLTPSVDNIEPINFA